MIQRVLTHVWIVVLLLGLLASNLEGGRVDSVIEPIFGRAFAAVGLRQYWAMFAPNPVHNGRFVEWTNITPEGERVVLNPSEEPPFPPGSEAWVGLGYTRGHKWDKQVALKPERFAKPTAHALCRIHGLSGSLELATTAYTTPSPEKRRAGTPITRRRTTEVFECP